MPFGQRGLQVPELAHDTPGGPVDVASPAQHVELVNDDVG
jgi:hypothetical protein